MAAMLPAEQLLEGGVTGLDLGLRRTAQEVMLLREVHRVRSGLQACLPRAKSVKMSSESSGQEAMKE
jgi:hypothetical protein